MFNNTMLNLKFVKKIACYIVTMLRIIVFN